MLLFIFDFILFFLSMVDVLSNLDKKIINGLDELVMLGLGILWVFLFVLDIVLIDS